MNQHYPFILPELGYDYSDLEPYIDTETMMVHHDKHLKTYIDNLNDALKNYPKYHDMNLITIIKMLRYFPIEIQRKVANNAGGVFNHILYFSILKNMDINNIPEPLKAAIIRDFSSVDNFINVLKEHALAIFGSGYTFLVVDKYGRLKFINTKNQDTPLNMGLYPILPVDVWEHAYYLKHKNLRADYIDDFIKVINFDKVNEYYEEYIKMFS